MTENDRVTLAMFPLDMALLWGAGATAMVALGSFGMGGFFAACSASMVGLYRLKVRRGRR